MALTITPGNTADSTVPDEMTQHLAGKLYADKGYIGRVLFAKLWRRGLHLITSIRRNMRNSLMPMADKIMLRKRFVIETVLDTLKSEMGLEHSRHRCNYLPPLCRGGIADSVRRCSGTSWSG